MAHRTHTNRPSRSLLVSWKLEHTRHLDSTHDAPSAHTNRSAPSTWSHDTHASMPPRGWTDAVDAMAVCSGIEWVHRLGVYVHEKVAWERRGGGTTQAACPNTLDTPWAPVPRYFYICRTC